MKLDPGFQQVTLNSKLPNTPEVTLAVSLDYEVSIGDDHMLLLHGDFSHNSSIENDSINSVFLKAGPTDIFNASASWVIDEQYTITFFGDNLTDERFITSGDSNYGIGFHEANFNRPREWGVRLKANF